MAQNSNGSIPPQEPIGDFATRWWQASNDGSVRGTLYTAFGGRPTRIEFDAANWDDLRLALIQLELLRRKHASVILRPA